MDERTSRWGAGGPRVAAVLAAVAAAVLSISVPAGSAPTAVDLGPLTEPSGVLRDGGWSVPLGGRLLWLFGDTFVGADGQADRAQAAFIHNSIALSECGPDGRFDVRYAWGRSEDGAPRAFVERDAGWWWLFGGFLHEGRLYVGMLEVEAYLHHAMTLPRLQRDMLAHAVNELINFAPSAYVPYASELAEEDEQRSGHQSEDQARDYRDDDDHPSSPS